MTKYLRTIIYLPIIALVALFLLLSHITSANSQSLSAQDCGLILSHGLWANNSFSHSLDRNDAAKTWACSKTTDGSGKGDLINRTVRANFSKSEHCSTTGRTAKEARKINSFWRKASSEIVAAWTTCTGRVDRNNFGLWVYADEISTNGGFSLVINWNDPLEGSSRLPLLNITLPDGIECNQSMPNTAPRARKTISCRNIMLDTQQRITASSSDTIVNVTARSGTILIGATPILIPQARHYRYFAKVVNWTRLGTVGISHDGRKARPAVLLTESDMGKLVEVTSAAEAALEVRGALNVTAWRVRGRSGQQTAFVEIYKGFTRGDAVILCRSIGVGTGLGRRKTCPF